MAGTALCEHPCADFVAGAIQNAFGEIADVRNAVFFNRTSGFEPGKSSSVERRLRDGLGSCSDHVRITLESFLFHLFLEAQISWQAQHFVNLHAQISWQAQHFANLEAQISCQAQHFVNLHAQISWQAQHFVNLHAQAFVASAALCEAPCADFVAGAAFCEPRCADFVAGTALCEHPCADFVAGAIQNAFGEIADVRNAVFFNRTSGFEPGKSSSAERRLRDGLGSCSDHARTVPPLWLEFSLAS